MPVFVVVRTTESTAYIEAPTAEIAVAEAKTWSRHDWDEDFHGTQVESMGVTKERPDFTVDLRGTEHEHDFDDEDTGGCIYCDERPAPASGDTSQPGGSP